MTSTSTTSKPAKTAPAEKVWKECMCGLGSGTQCPAKTLKSFAQGHDARMASRIAQAVADSKLTPQKAEDLIRKAGGGDLLVGKMHRSAKLRMEAAKAKAQTAKDKAAAKAAAKDEAKTETAPGPQVGQEVKVSHGQRAFKAVVVKDAAKNLVARHKLNGENCDHEITV